MPLNIKYIPISCLWCFLYCTAIRGWPRYGHR